MDGIFKIKYPWTYFDNSAIYFKPFWQPCFTWDKPNALIFMDIYLFIFYRDSKLGEYLHLYMFVPCDNPVLNCKLFLKHSPFVTV